MIHELIGLASEVISWGFIVAGSAGVIISTFGLVRLPDFYTRLHAGGVTDTVGAELIIVGLAIQAGFSLIAAKLILIGLFLFFTGPTATHATANAAYIAGLRPQLADMPGKDDEP